MFTVTKNGIELKHKTFLFPGGEVGVKVDIANSLFRYERGTNTTIIARIHNSNELFELSLLKDAIDRFVQYKDKIDLWLTYCPYGRQDRVCDEGESHSLKILGDYINSLNFNTVTVFDPHSDVIGSVINRVQIIEQHRIIALFDELNKRILQTGAQFVSPDAGGNKKTFNLVKAYARDSFIRADKIRDAATGNIKETVVLSEDLKGATVVIADDICDGGRTFIELAKALKAKNCGKVILYVTHAIFSKGVDPLLAGGIDEIFITDSWGEKTQWNLHPAVKTLSLEQAFHMLIPLRPSTPPSRLT